MNTSLLGRYWPLAAGVALPVTLTLLFPSVVVRPTPLSGAADNPGFTTGAASGTPGSPGATRTPGRRHVGARPGTSTPSAAAQSGPEGPPSVDGLGPITAASLVGVNRNGQTCGAGVRQVNWSVYAPPCVAAYHGYNGGSTSHGVTGDAIVFSYRRSNSNQDAALSAAVGDAAPGTDDQMIADLNSYIALFNSTYELYGRHVVLRDFQGQGDWIAEDDGQDQPQAVADAQTAHDLGAFADVTMPYKSSFYYWAALAHTDVVTFGLLGPPQSVYEQNSPYAYGSERASSTSAVKVWAPILCRRMAGLPAVFAGDVATQHTQRVFGFVTPDNPDYVRAGDELAGALSACGVTFAKRVAYSIDATQFESQSASIVAQMRSAGVTSVVCWCDPVFLVFQSNSADHQRYHPEWLEPGWPEPFPRSYAKDQWQHALSIGAVEWQPRPQREDYRAFQLATGGAPREQYSVYLYQELVNLFAGIQAAGPQLTPSTFERGLRSLPDSPVGEFGPWGFGAHNFTPYQAAQLTWWNPQATSGFDGGTGAWTGCEGSRWFRFDHPDVGPAGTQLHCFGQ